ncbi:unnamed protein product [Taenia asiatica]|uniref:FAR1 domain-containing protein n=1 Tax=Taenia asiatica TaxID=60517 RepID=A0A0R3WG36_TAEAS|nr:unnamed protein product [Taenia asiatica]
MDLTDVFERLFTGKHFTSDAEFEQACEAFKKETGCRFARRHVIYRQTPLEGLPNLLLKQGQFTCSVSYCDAFFAVGSKKSGVYVTRFNMHHIHGPMPEETYNVVCDLTDVFRQFFQVDRYRTYDEFHNLLIAFQNHTGSSYVKRHTVRWPADAIDRQHLVYARAHFECVRYGWSESNATSRPVVSKRIGCKAYVVIQTYKGWVEIFHLNMQHNHEITQDDAGHPARQPRRLQTNKQVATTTSGGSESGSNYTYLSAPSKDVGSPNECMSQSVLRRLHGRRVKGEECLKTGDFIVEDGNSGSLVLATQIAEDTQTITAEAAKVALLDSHLEAVRNLAIVEYGIVGAQGVCSEAAIAMCAELKQMEGAWRRCLAETEEQKEAAPILLEFAGASATTSTRSSNVVQLNTHLA